MLKKVVFASLIIALVLCVASHAGNAVYFDAQGNQISAEEYNTQVEADRAKREAGTQALEESKRRRAMQRAVQYQKEQETASAAQEAQETQATQPTKVDQKEAKALASIDKMIADQHTGVNTPAPVKSDLNTFDCYTYGDIFAMAEDMYSEYINGRSVIKMVLMNGVWRKVDPCQEEYFRVGERLPHVKNVEWSWNNLNKVKTGAYKGS